MPGVGDELLLHLQVAHIGLDGPAREQQHQYEYRREAERGHRRRRGEQAAHRAQLALRVEEDDALRPAVPADEVAVALVKAARPAARQRAGGVSGGLLFGDGGDEVVVDAGDVAAGVVVDGEKAYHVRHLAGEGPAAARRRLLEGKVRPAPVRRGEQVQRAVELVRDAAVVPQVQAAEQHEYHRRYGRHGRAYKAPGHTLQHPARSNT